MVAWMGTADRDYKLEDIEITLKGTSIQVSNFTPILGGAVHNSNFLKTPQSWAVANFMATATRFQRI